MSQHEQSFLVSVSCGFIAATPQRQVQVNSFQLRHRRHSSSKCFRLFRWPLTETWRGLETWHRRPITTEQVSRPITADRPFWEVGLKGRELKWAETEQDRLTDWSIDQCSRCCALGSLAAGVYQIIIRCDKLTWSQITTASSFSQQSKPE